MRKDKVNGGREVANVNSRGIIAQPFAPAFYQPPSNVCHLKSHKAEHPPRYEALRAHYGLEVSIPIPFT